MRARSLAIPFAVALVAAGAGYFWMQSSDREISSRALSQPASGTPVAGSPGRFDQPPERSDDDPATVTSDRKAGAGTPLIESVVLSQGGIRVDRAFDLAQSEGFERFLAELERQNAMDVEARQLTSAYSKEFADVVAAAKLDVGVEKMACGLSICAVDLTGPQRDDGVFTPLMNSGKKSGARVFTAVTAIVPNRDGTFSYRMIFTTDPRFNSVQVPRRDWQPLNAPGS